MILITKSYMRFIFELLIYICSTMCSSSIRNCFLPAFVETCCM